MYDELTRADLQKMQEEIDYRVQQLRPKLIEDVQTAGPSATSARTSSTSAPSRRKTATTPASATSSG